MRTGKTADHRFKTSKLEEYIALQSLEAGHYTLSIPVRVSPEQKALLIKYSTEEYGKKNVSKYIRDYLEKHLFKFDPSPQTLIEQKLSKKLKDLYNNEIR